MQLLAVIASVLLLACNLLVVVQASQAVRVITFNIRYDATSRESGEKPWFEIFCFITKTRCRMNYNIETISKTAEAAPSGAVTVIGLQEVLSNQLSDIKNGLGKKWAHVGVGRDDGKRRGEFSPILYRTDALRVLYWETKWLSPTPDVVSYGWGAGSRRIVTVAVFESLSTGTRFIHANTHLDNVSSQARSEGIKVVVDRIKAVQGLWGPLGVTITGDFNSQPGGDAYQTLANTGYAQDLYYKATAAQRVDPYGKTYTGFKESAAKTSIDFIWLGPTADYRFSVQRYEVVNNVVKGVYVSDHRLVVGDVTVL